MATVVTILSGIVTACVTGFLGWFFGRKKQNAEVSSIRLDNMQKEYDMLMKMNKEAMEHIQKLEAKLLNTNTFVTDAFTLLCGDLKCTNRSSIKIIWDELGPHIDKTKN